MQGRPLFHWLARGQTWPLALALPCALLGACANLPDVPGGQCGNAIVESDSEDCDTHQLNASSRCRTREQVGACHFDCSPRSDGTSWQCPPGWGCDFNQVCREPTGGFEAPASYPLGGVASLLSGDFDGDGRDDIVSRKPRDRQGRSTLSFHYFDARGALVDTRAFPMIMSEPVVGSLSAVDDGRADLLFTDFRLGVLLGRSDRTWVPETFSPYVLPDVTVRMVGVSEDYIDDVSPLVALSTLEPGTGLYTPDRRAGRLALRAPFAGPLEQLAGEPVTGDIIEASGSPCSEVVIAMRGATSFDLFDMCARAEDQQVVWRGQALRHVVALVPAAPVDTAPLIADVNLDGHLDVMLGAGGKVYAAYGDGVTLADAVPYEPALANPGAFINGFSMPLAVGDITADGELDFVLPEAIYVSVLLPGATLPRYEIANFNVNGAWTVAKLADLNANGKVDVVAASRSGVNVDFFNGTGSRYLLALQIPTSRPVSHLTVGDFDGDQIGDLSFVEAAQSPDGLDVLMVAFGSASQPPATPIPVARVSHAVELAAYREGGLGALILAYTRSIAGVRQSVLSILDGSPQRIPFSPLALVSFASDQSLADHAAVLVTLGAFTGPAAKDVVALGLYGGESIQWALWLVPSLDVASATPQRLTGNLDARLRPFLERASGSAISVVATAADLDGDQRDEAVFALPADFGAHCGLQTFQIDAPLGSASSTGLSVLDQPCLDPQLSAVDVDGDSAIDLALLTGSERELDRKLFVLWNDGSGHFDPARSTLVNTSGAAPQAFTFLRPSPNQTFRFAYVTTQAIMTVARSSGREFAAPQQIGAPLTQGNAISAADVNGDDVVDLVLADDGNLTVLNAQLTAPR